MEPLFEVKTVLTEPLYRECCRLRMRRNPAKFVSFGAGILLLGLGLFWLVAEAQPFVAVLAFLAAVFMFFYPKLLEHMTATRMLKSMKSTIGYPLTVRFYDTCFTQTSAYGEARIPYADLYRIREDDGLILLFINRIQMAVIDKRRIPAGMAGKIVEHIRSQSAVPYACFK